MSSHRSTAPFAGIMRVGFLPIIASMLWLAGFPGPAAAEWTCFATFGGCDAVNLTYPQVNATVGLPFKWELRAGCDTGQWTLAGVEFQTGRLPPGLEYDPAQYAIVGVPTLAGSFSFQVLLRGLSCPGSRYRPGGDGDWAKNYTITVTGN